MADNNGTSASPTRPVVSLDRRATSGSSRSSGVPGRLRSASLDKFLESSPPSGMWDATADVLAKAPTPMEIRRGSFSHNGWDGPMQRRHTNTDEESVRRLSLSRSNSAQTAGAAKSPTTPMDTHTEEHDDEFAGFFGRERMDNQSFSQEVKLVHKKAPDLYPLDVDEEEDDAVNPRPARKLPNKFADPSGDAEPFPYVSCFTIQRLPENGVLTPESSLVQDYYPTSSPNRQRLHPHRRARGYQRHLPILWLMMIHFQMSLAEGR